MEKDEVESLRIEIQSLRLKLAEKEEECQSMRSQLQIERFGVERFSNDIKLIKFYTGLPNYKILYTLYLHIYDSANSMQSLYYEACETPSPAGRPRNMQLIDEFFMFLCRVKAGLLEQDLAVRFNIHISSVSRKCLTWCNFLYFVLGSIPIWPSKQQVNDNMPLCFKRVYPNTRIILDCTEIKTQAPSSLLLASQLYSNYKSSHTLKALVGIAPNGAITFISPLYSGCMSDVEIVKLSGVLDLIEQGDSVMADKGFTIDDLLEEKGVTLNIPPFLRDAGSTSGQFTQKEIEQTQQIAAVRIHVERAIRRINEFHFFDSIVPLTLTGSINQLWTVCACLCNFQGPLIDEK